MTVNFAYVRRWALCKLNMNLETWSLTKRFTYCSRLTVKFGVSVNLVCRQRILLKYDITHFWKFFAVNPYRVCRQGHLLNLNFCFVRPKMLLGTDARMQISARWSSKIFHIVFAFMPFLETRNAIVGCLPSRIKINFFKQITAAHVGLKFLWFSIKLYLFFKLLHTILISSYFGFAFYFGKLTWTWFW